MGRLLANWYIYIYNNLYYQSGTIDSLTMYSDAILGALKHSGTLYATYLIVRTVGFGLLTVYMIISLGTKMMGRETSTSVLVKTFLQYFVGYAIALKSFDIVEWLFQWGDWLAETVVDGISEPSFFDEYAGAFTNGLDNLNILAQSTYMFKAFFPYVVCVTTNLIIMYIIISRVLRICVNATLSPIAAVNFFDDSRHSDGVKFIKRTLAMSLQCAAIMVITAAVSSLTQAMAVDSVYKNDIRSEITIEEAQQELIESAKAGDRLFDEIQLFRDVEIGDAYKETLSEDDRKKLEACRAITTNTESVTADMEEEYKKYEDLIGMDVYQKENEHYVYDDEGHAKINSEYLEFDEETMRNFMDKLMSKNNYFIFIVLLVIRMGLIKKSNSLCNLIVGL